MAGQYDFECEQGATFSRALVIKNASGPIDLTEFTARMQVRAEVDDSPYLISLVEGDGIGIENLAGRITIEIPVETTSTIPRSGVYDLEIIDGAGQAHRLLQGKFLLSPGVTRDA